MGTPTPGTRFSTSPPVAPVPSHAPCTSSPGATHTAVSGSSCQEPSPKSEAPPRDPKTAHPPGELVFRWHWTGVALYVSFLVFCNVLIPCLLFYLLRIFTPMPTKELIGISSAALGVSSCFDAPFRLYRLVRFRNTYGPLGLGSWWHLDFVMWTYTFALLVFAIPLAVSPPAALFTFFLMSTTMLVGPVGVVFLYSLFSPVLPCRCSSDPRGTRMKPAVFYTIEDVAAVDFKHGRAFREALYTRYHTSPPFRALVRKLTVYWVFASVLYCGLTAAVTWGAPLQFSFGWVLGQFFLWVAASAAGCVFLAKRGMRQEKEWWEEGAGKMGDFS
ncbi:hypothetical protein BD779DRAFT_1678991 [Infundibulicybe gibba]|nr:hypothetical protein BD779DRAFT_1678991 [Infundibulicybe gibba]